MEGHRAEEDEMSRWYWMNAYGNKIVHKVVRRASNRDTRACNHTPLHGRGFLWDSDEKLQANLTENPELTVCQPCADYQPPTPEQVVAAEAEWEAIAEANSRSVRAIPTAFERNRRRH